MDQIYAFLGLMVMTWEACIYPFMVEQNLVSCKPLFLPFTHPVAVLA